MIPLLVAFQDNRQELIYTVVDYLTNILFALNICVIFFTAFFDEEYDLITDRMVRIIFVNIKHIGDRQELHLLLVSSGHPFSYTF